jgi:hypothetical protein
MLVIKPSKNLDLVLELWQQINLPREKYTDELTVQLAIINYWGQYNHSRWKQAPKFIYQQIEELQSCLQEDRQYLQTKYFKDEEQRL